MLGKRIEFPAQIAKRKFTRQSWEKGRNIDFLRIFWYNKYTRPVTIKGPSYHARTVRMAQYMYESEEA